MVSIGLGDIDVHDTRFQLRLMTRAGDLRKSLEKAGQQVPVILWGHSPPYKIVDGFRRIAALSSLGREAVKAILADGLSERDALRLSFLQNAKRRNFSPLDRANALWTLSQMDDSDTSAARDLGLSERQAARYLQLLQFAKPIQQAVEKRDITMAHATVLSKYEIPNVPELIRTIKAEKLSAEGLAKRLRGMRKQDGRARKFGQISKDGIRLYPAKIPFDAPGSEKARLIAFLKKALEFLEGAVGNS